MPYFPQDGPASDSYAYDYVERKKAAREKERMRARERYRKQRAERIERGEYKGPGRPALGAPEKSEATKVVLISEKAHALLSALAAERSYQPDCDRRVSIRELLEEAVIVTYPREIARANISQSERARQVLAEQSVLAFEEIMRRALADPFDTDPATSRIGLGFDKVAYEIPTPARYRAKGQPETWSWRYTELIQWLAHYMGTEKAESVTDLHSLCEAFAGQKFDRPEEKGE